MKDILLLLIAVFVLPAFESSAQNTVFQNFSTVSAPINYAYVTPHKEPPPTASYIPGQQAENAVIIVEEVKSITATTTYTPRTDDAFMTPKTLNLLWNVPEEYTSNYYAIEKSAVSGNFVQVGIVVSGNPEIAHDFTYMDTSLLHSDTSYFRLRDIDDENEGHISNIEWVGIYNHDHLIAYPDTDRDNLNIRLDNHELNKIIISGTDGKLYLQQVYAGKGDNLKLNVTNLPVGIYFVMVSNKNSINCLRFVKG